MRRRPHNGFVQLSHFDNHHAITPTSDMLLCLCERTGDSNSTSFAAFSSHGDVTRTMTCLDVLPDMTPNKSVPSSVVFGSRSSGTVTWQFARRLVPRDVARYITLAIGKTQYKYHAQYPTQYW
ncbi:hypothetical protein LZ31DRAFT_300831 [Colletotrichum somersetense]|nr:hypothetical protein LZ31DRAFT_300831 [Colletotrichum somersetense]